MMNGRRNLLFQDTLDGFDQTLAACQKLGLDLSRIPPAALRIFYVAGMAHGGGMSELERATWKRSADSVLSQMIVSF